MVKKWIQKSKMKKGALSRQLEIPIEDNIPFTLLEKIVAADISDTISNPMKSGKRRIHITSLIHSRANMALNLKNIRR